MRVCMISAHTPPEQSANALLPVMLGGELTRHGVDVSYVVHPTRDHPHTPPADGVVLTPRRGRGRFGRTIGGAVLAGSRMALGARGPIKRSDVVHLHSNGFIVEVGAFLADRFRKPSIVTLYGTDVWHYDPVRHGRFGRAVRDAACRVFYSQGLLDFAETVGLAPNPSIVIYAPVPPGFRPLEPDERAAVRRELGLGEAPLLLTVKRLHQVAGHDVLLRALPEVLRQRPGTQLWLAGRGDLRPALEALARELGVADRVRFLGLLGNDDLWRYYAAADLFVLPSRLESWGTVTLEALACGTPVVATDTAGGLEVQRHFPDDVTIVEKENASALAAAISHALDTRRRAGRATRHTLEAEFSVQACAAQYLSVYREIAGSRGQAHHDAHAR